MKMKSIDRIPLSFARQPPNINQTTEIVTAHNGTIDFRVDLIYHRAKGQIELASLTNTDTK